MVGERISVRNQDLKPPRLHFLYHELRALPSRYSYALQTAVFKKHLDLIAEARAKQDLGVTVEITFDDGHASDFEVALPILNAHGLTARFFITTGWTGTRAGYMDWAEVRRLLDAGHVIGSHGWSHMLLTRCSPADLKFELRQSRSVLEERLGIPITTMSLPGGRYNARVLSACEEAGYTKVYTSVPTVELSAAEYIIGRVNMNSRMTIDRVSRLLDPDGGELRRLRRQYRKKEVAKGILGDSLYENLWSCLFRKQKDVHPEKSPLR